MTEPTICRLVHYHPGEGDSGHAHPENVQSAIICAVNEDKSINLLVIDRVGNCYPKTNVKLHQDGEAPSGGGFAEFPPFVKAQSAKSEPQGKKEPPVMGVDAAQPGADETVVFPPP